MIAGALGKVFGNFWYWPIAIGIFSSTLLFAIWLPNLSFLGHVAVSAEYTQAQKFLLFARSLSALGTNFTPFSRFLTIAIALLFAINMTMVIYHARRKSALQHSVGLGWWGIASGLVGIGCASCGSVILSSILGLGAAASFIGILPLQGNEFGLLGIGIILFSIFLTSKKIQEPLTC